MLKCALQGFTLDQDTCTFSFESKCESFMMDESMHCTLLPLPPPAMNLPDSFSSSPREQRSRIQESTTFPLLIQHHRLRPTLFSIQVASSTARPTQTPPLHSGVRRALL